MEEFNSTNEPQLEAQKPVVTPEAFDWDTYEKGDSIDTNRQRDRTLRQNLKPNSKPRGCRGYRSVDQQT